MYTDNYINSLQAELLELVESRLTPAAMRYGYSDSPLETNIKWRPLVLIIGNYSSGKSTLINDFLGADVQATGQAPTDDSFTVLTYDNTVPDETEIRVVDQRDGKYLLANKEYPFEGLKKHGQQFASHFCIKTVNSPFLKNFAIIDAPGMLDSITERDRGYDYQKVIGDLAHVADLVLVLFDPHKAGTVREAHISLRDTLPAQTFEDRVLFVLNRIDECASLNDLLRVYGTLCWNLSQITGRKDIPPIRLTYSPMAADRSNTTGNGKAQHLIHLENQREELREALMRAPHYHLDHLATFLETHSERLAHLLEALVAYGKKRRRVSIKFALTGLALALLIGTGSGMAMLQGGLAPTPMLVYISGGLCATGFMMLWVTVLKKYFFNRFHGRQLKLVDELTPLDNQYRKETWQAIKKTVINYLKTSEGKFSLGIAKLESDSINEISNQETQEIREALSEIATMKNNDKFNPSSAYQAFLQRKTTQEEQDKI